MTRTIVIIAVVVPIGTVIIMIVAPGGIRSIVKINDRRGGYRSHAQHGYNGHTPQKGSCAFHFSPCEVSISCG